VSAASAAGGARALDCLHPVPNDRLEIRNDPAKGRGIFACRPIAAGTLIEAAPIIIIPAGQCPLIERTTLHDYYFHWDGNPDGGGRGAVALGLVTLCNHSRRPNARVRRNLSQDTLDLIATAPVAAGDEVTIDYNCPLWFEPQD
jgi:SET domain-containing protein